MNEKKQKAYELAWYLGVFAFMYIWFTRIHPMVVYDADDWTYIGYIREAMPVWGDWNPARVLPEVFMPFCSAAASYLLMPLTGDYIGSLTIMNAIVVSAFITVYVRCFGELVKRVFSLSALNTAFASALFLVFHFLVFRSRETDNIHMFHCVNVTCYYYYLIPSLLCASLAMYMTENSRFENFLAQGSMAKKSLFCLALYFAIFSNLSNSVILAVYAGSRLLIDFVKQVKTEKKDFRLTKFLRADFLFAAILLAWLISAVYELNGGRSMAAQGQTVSLLYNLKVTVWNLLDMVRSCSGAFLITAAVLMAAAGILFFLSRKKERADRDFLTQAVIWLVCGAAMGVCLIVLCAMVEPAYMYRSEYLFGLVFYGFMILMVCFAYVIRKQPKVILAVPIILCILISEINTRGNTFAEANMSALDAETCTRISNDLVEQVAAAEQAGQTEMTLYVPVWETEDNWPHAAQLMHRISYALEEHGIIEQPIKVTVEPSQALNEKYGLPIPGAETESKE